MPGLLHIVYESVHQTNAVSITSFLHSVQSYGCRVVDRGEKSNSGQIITLTGELPFVCLVCMSNVLEALETIPGYYGCYFYAVIYRRMGILPRKGFEGRLTVIGIAQFQKKR